MNTQVPARNRGRERRLDSDVGTGREGEGTWEQGKGERVEWGGAGAGDVGQDVEEEHVQEDEESAEVDWFRVSTGAGACV